jgi:hypothetical protein
VARAPAALTFFNPIVDIILMVSLIALVVAVAYGQCSHPTIETGVIACGKAVSDVAINAITDLIHRLLELIAPHRRPEVIHATGFIVGGLKGRVAKTFVMSEGTVLIASAVFQRCLAVCTLRASSSPRRLARPFRARAIPIRARPL